MKYTKNENYWTTKQLALCTIYQRKISLTSKKNLEYKPIKIAYRKINWKQWNNSKIH